MTISIDFADGKGGRTEAGDVATNSGWAAFGAWVDSLQADDAHGRIVDLWEWGKSFHVEELAGQLRKALETSPPPAAVRSVALNLIALAEANADSEGVFVADDS